MGLAVPVMHCARNSGQVLNLTNMLSIPCRKPKADIPDQQLVNHRQTCKEAGSLAKC